MNVLKELSAEYPLFYLNPDVDSKETYRGVVLVGEDPGKDSLDHYIGDARDNLESIETPVGAVRVLTLGNRQDFELVCRGLMAAKEGPEREVPKTQGAGMFVVFNWGRINAHLSGFPEDERAEEFKKFTSVKANYVDNLVLLSIGPYSNISAETVGEAEDTWLSHSNIIRRDHELTHFICRKKYPGDIVAVRDELIADAVGLYSAYGTYRADLARVFLGIGTDANGADTYLGGRLENYTDDPVKELSSVCTMIEKIKEIAETVSESPFDLIAPLMEQPLV